MSDRNDEHTVKGVGAYMAPSAVKKSKGLPMYPDAPIKLPSYRVQINASQSTKGITSIDCTIEYNFESIPELKDTMQMNSLMLHTIENAEQRFHAHGYALATKQ